MTFKLGLTRYEALCRDCDEWSTVQDTAEESERWAWEHTEGTGHTRFSLVEEKSFTTLLKRIK